MSIEILAHRGYWKNKSEMNSIEAFQRAIEHGFGIETDLRDRSGQLIVAHDYNEPRFLKAEDLFNAFGDYPLTLAINVKSSGLESLVLDQLNRSRIQKYFVFDLSVPDLLRYQSLDMPLYTRLSEYESMGNLDNKAAGFWIDQFHSQWFNQELIRKILNTEKKMCFVSPELHGRDPFILWELLKGLQNEFKQKSVQICTDHPVQLKKFLDE